MSTENENRKEIKILHYLDVLVKYRWMIIRNVLMTIFLVLVISFLLPKKYTAVATLMPPSEHDKTSMSKVLSDVSVPGLSLSGKVSPAEILGEILKSRSVGERVLSKRFATEGDSLPLYRILDCKSLRICLYRIPKFTKFIVSEQGLIRVYVELGNAKLAADVANAFIDALDNVNQEKSVSRAKNSRLYIESQLEKTERNLSKATKTLAKFQQKHRAVSLEEQTKASILQMGELKGRITAKEIELGVMLKTMKPENPLIIQANRELEQLREQYEKLQNGTQMVNEEKGDVFMPFTNVPEMGVRLAELTREVKVQETVWQLLNQQYYQTRIEEARDTPTVQVLDQAVPPPFASFPQKKQLVIVFGLLSLVFSILLAFILEHFQKLDRHPEEKRHWKAIFQQVQNDYRQIRKRIRLSKK
jgi:uncharacterized protein involved in exopolysaccharide biosynthesis